nr:PREDICTED: rab3 GTPase-activating protein non-catalytic subunit [Bemisia tabaci]
MSCHLKPFAKLLDLDSIQRSLSFPEITENAGETETQKHGKSDTSSTDSKWLKDCHISVSPTGEMMVIANKHNMIILNSKWDAQEESEVKMKYRVSECIDPRQIENETVTSVLVLPLAIAQNRKSSVAQAEWICIMVGFSTGYVRFFTELGLQLLSHPLHDEPILKLKCQSYQPGRHSMCGEQLEEVYVVYPSCICILPGPLLFNVLRACRNQLARVTANCSDIVPTPPLTFKKWGYKQGQVTDSAVVGLTSANMFQHLYTASVCGGFNSWYQSSAPQSTLVVASGKPFLGFHYVLGSGSQQILSDLAKLVTNKLKSALGNVVSGWLGGGGRRGSASSEKQAPVIEPPEAMSIRFGLNDVNRQSSSVLLSPQRNLAAICDNLGRVILVDCNSGLAIRMWKGYRNAQCGWLEVKEEERKARGHRRTALFLVIYAPKKALIEIWAMQQGPKVASFPVDNYGRLVYNNYELMCGNGTSRNSNQGLINSCLFIDPLGQISEIFAPFHCALNTESSVRAQDIHLVKNLRHSLHSDETSEEKLIEEVKKTAMKLKTFDMKSQCLDLLINDKYTSPSLLSAFLDNLESNTEDEMSSDLNPEHKELYIKVRNLRSLVSFYQFVHALHLKPPEYSTVVESDDKHVEALCETLQITEEEFERLNCLVRSSDMVDEGKSRAKVTFSSNKGEFSEFLNSFNLNAENGVISLVCDFAEEKLFRISELVCQGAAGKCCPIVEWQSACRESQIMSFDLLKILLKYWLKKKHQSKLYYIEMLNFTKLIIAVCQLNGIKSHFWPELRKLIAASTDCISALSISFIFRGVAAMFEKIVVEHLDKNSKESLVAADDEEATKVYNLEDWENVSADGCEWSQMIDDLTEVAALCTTLCKVSIRSFSSECSVAHLPYENPSINLNSLLSEGKGFICELVAKWLGANAIHPDFIIDKNDIEFHLNNVESPKANAKRKRDSSPPKKSLMSPILEGSYVEVDESREAKPVNQHEAYILESLIQLKKHFPYILSSSNILANLAWEYILAWQRSLETMELFSSAVQCLRLTPSLDLKQGLCSLIWTTHLQQRFELAVRLIHKVGKVPKERLCMQDVGFSDEKMTTFLSICSQFIDVFVEAAAVAGISPKSNRHKQKLYKQIMLCRLASEQAEPNFDLLCIIRQCVEAFLILATFNLKTTKPLQALFDSNSQAAMFSDITKQPQLQISRQGMDVKLIESRVKFLKRAVSSAVQLIEKTVNQNNEIDLNTVATIDWISKIMSLVSDWAISPDIIRMHYVCELYHNGYDRLAEEIIPAVRDQDEMGTQLLIIAGQRIKQFIIQSHQFRETTSNLSPAVTSWLASLEENETMQPSNTPDIGQLLRTVISLLPDNHKDKALASLVLEGLPSCDR